MWLESELGLGHVWAGWAGIPRALSGGLRIRVTLRRNKHSSVAGQEVRFGVMQLKCGLLSAGVGMDYPKDPGT